jgi:hypothetical protein
MLKKLQQLKHRADCEKYPSMPPDYITLYKYTDKTANGLTRCVVDWITFHGYQAERVSNMGRVIGSTQVVTDVLGIRRSIGSTKYVPGAGTNGTADISATIMGRSVKIEIKIGKDRQSSEQKSYEQSIVNSGGVYWIVRDFNSFVEMYESYLNTLSK